MDVAEPGARDLKLTDLLEGGSEATREIERRCRVLLRSKFATNPLARHQSEDLVQDVLLACFRQATKIAEGHSPPIENLNAWLSRVVMNAVWRTWHKEGDGQTTDLEEPVVARLKAPEALGEAERLTVRQALGRLDAACRELLWKRDVLGEARHELADRLGTKSNVLGVRLHRCRKRLLEIYQTLCGR